jgi:hypothetical protein
MAIGTLHVEWLSSLALRSALPRRAAVLDLGVQDLWMEREPLHRVARRHLRPGECERAMAAIFDDGTARPRSDAQAAFYSIFGADSHRSIDLNDPRADHATDLNHPLPSGIGRYDVVTNFGTTEHVFNIGQTFASIHGLLEVGGLQLHTLPSYGAIDHGFYNIHPCAYLDIARANHYDVVDFLYVDNINVRMARPIEAAPFDFRSLPIQRRDMADTNAFMTRTAVQFYRNLVSPETRSVLEGMAPKDPSYAPRPMPDDQLPISVVFDMMFVALRRTKRSPCAFVAPLQGIYSGPKDRPDRLLARLRRWLRA